MEDTVKAADYMEKNNDIKCVIILGGDGTNRAAAKSLKTTPIITISTGTNNVYPTMLEGTVAGMAAAVVASGLFDDTRYVTKDKRIEIYKDGDLIDIDPYRRRNIKGCLHRLKGNMEYGYNRKNYRNQISPGFNRFFFLGGVQKIIYPEDDFGAYVDINSGSVRIKAPVAAGVVESVSVSEPVILRLEDEYEFIAKDRGTIALDGEREIEFKKDQKLIFKITREGPYHVDVIKALETAQENNFFIIKN